MYILRNRTLLNWGLKGFYTCAIQGRWKRVERGDIFPPYISKRQSLGQPTLIFLVATRILVASTGPVMYILTSLD